MNYGMAILLYIPFLLTFIIYILGKDFLSF